MTKAATVLALDALPMWTKRVRTESAGRDPLGLSRFGGNLTDYLLQGIITTTARARYYSFYPWLLWKIDQTGRSARYLEYRAAFRRGEAFMALATLAHNPSSSPVGILATTPKLNSARAGGWADLDFKVLPANELGGYGQYYGGSLYQLGLTERQQSGVDTVTARGQEIALVYERAVAKSRFIKKGCFAETSVPLEVVTRSAEEFSVDCLSDGEVAELTSLFFSLQDDAPSARALLRRQTLALILNTVSAYGEAGVGDIGDDLDWRIVYSCHYFGELWLGERKSKPYRSPATFETARVLWQQFTAHQFLCYSLENLLYAVLEAVRLNPSGLNVTEICDAVVDAGLEKHIQEISGSRVSSPRGLLGKLGVHSVPTEEECFHSRRRMTLFERLNERAVSEYAPESPAASCAIALVMLCILYSKWRSASSKELNYLSAKAGGELWIANVLPLVDEWFSSGVDWQAALKSLLSPVVLDTHDRIMYEKGQLGSRWFRRLDGKVVFDQEYEPTWRSSRHDNCVSILSDLGLLETKNKSVTITARGRKLLRRVVDGSSAS